MSKDKEITKFDSFMWGVLVSFSFTFLAYFLFLDNPTTIQQIEKAHELCKPNNGVAKIWKDTAYCNNGAHFNNIID